MLNGDELGNDLYTKAVQWDDVDIANLEQARQDYWKAVGNVIVDYFIANGVINVTVATTGTATAQTGTGTGTIK